MKTKTLGWAMSALLFTGCSLFLSGVSLATPWSKTYGGNNTDFSGPMLQTKDGGYILTSYSASFGSGGYNLWVLKLNLDGSIAWQKNYGGPEQDTIGFIDQTSEGGYVVGGSTSSFGAGENAAWLLKLDPNGNIEWQNTYGGNVLNVFESVHQTSSGGYIAVGGTSSSGAGKWDAWVVKLTASGTIEWQKTYGGAEDDWFHVVRETQDKGFITAGGTSSFGALKGNIWVMKLDKNGEILWEKTYGGPERDAVLSLDQTSDGGCILAGVTGSFGAGKDDAWLLKLDAIGKIEWQKTYGGSEDDVAHSVQQTSEGGYIVAGETYSFGKGASDLWLLKLEADGTIEWQKTYGGSNYDFASSAMQTPDGGYIVSGNTLSFGLGGYDLWVLKLDAEGNLGNLPDCLITGISNAVVTATAILEKDSKAIVKPTHILPNTTKAVVLDTTITPIPLCQPAIAAFPDRIDFGPVKIGSSGAGIVSIWNSGSENIVLGTLGIGGEDASQFHIGVDCSGQTLTPSTSCNAHIYFYPTSEGTRDAILSVPSSVVTQGTLTVSLTGQGVTSSGITLSAPSDQTSLGPCSLYQTPGFSWNGTEYFKSYEVQFSLEEGFGSIPVKVKSTTGPYAKIPSGTWKKVLALVKDREPGTPVFWRVVGLKPDKTRVTSNTFSLFLDPPRPIGSPNISPTGKGTLPTLSWMHYCNIKFKVIFTGDGTNKKVSLSYSVKVPTDIGELFKVALTSAQWDSVRKLAGNEIGKTISWYVEAWDGLNRYGRTDPSSFVLTE